MSAPSENLVSLESRLTEALLAIECLDEARPIRMCISWMRAVLLDGTISNGSASPVEPSARGLVASVLAVVERAADAEITPTAEAGA